MLILRAIRRRVLQALGYSDCPLCREQAVCWHGCNPIHPDGPPILQFWRCHSCGAVTAPEPTAIVHKAAADLGVDVYDNPFFAAFKPEPTQPKEPT